MTKNTRTNHNIVVNNILLDKLTKTFNQASDGPRINTAHDFNGLARGFAQPHV